MDKFLEALFERGLSGYDLDPEEAGSAFAVIVWYATAWADGKVQDAEEATIEQMKKGLGLVFSDKCIAYLDEVADLFRTRKPPDSIVDEILTIAGNSSQPEEQRNMTAAGLFIIAKAHGGVFSKISGDEKEFLNDACRKMGVDYNDAKKLAKKMMKL